MHGIEAPLCLQNSNECYSVKEHSCSINKYVFLTGGSTFSMNKKNYLTHLTNFSWDKKNPLNQFDFYYFSLFQVITMNTK